MNDLEQAIFKLIFYMAVPVMFIVVMTCFKYLFDKWTEQ